MNTTVTDIVAYEMLAMYLAKTSGQSFHQDEKEKGLLENAVTSVHKILRNPGNADPVLELKIILHKGLSLYLLKLNRKLPGDPMLKKAGDLLQELFEREDWHLLCSQAVKEIEDLTPVQARWRLSSILRNGLIAMGKQYAGVKDLSR